MQNYVEKLTIIFAKILSSLNVVTSASFSYLSLNWQMLFYYRALAGSFTKFNKFVIFPTSLHWIKIRISQTLEEGQGAYNFFFLLLSAADAQTRSHISLKRQRGLLSLTIFSSVIFSKPLSSRSHFPFRGKNWRKVGTFNPQMCLTLDKERNYFHFHP